MTGLKDRHGRPVGVILSGGGISRPAGEAGFNAALRLRLELAGRPGGQTGHEVCAAGIKKIFGVSPETAEISIAGKKILLAVPSDLGGFISDLHGIILRDQYNAAGIKGLTVADCGANIGIFSLYALALGARKVYAYEAVAETFKLLDQNLRLNGSPGRIKAACAALGAAPGRAELKFNTRGEGSAMIGGEDTVNACVSYSARRAVKLRPLDALVKGRLDFIKIDVEGCEKEVLLGAARLIKRWKPVLSFAAYHRQKDKKALPAAVRAIMPGYRIKLNGYAEQDLYCEYR